MREMQRSASRVVAPGVIKPKKQNHALLLWIDSVLRRGIDIVCAGLAIVLLSPFYFPDQARLARAGDVPR